GLKAQKHKAHGIAMGKHVSRCTPCKGKSIRESKRNNMIITCFFPYRAQSPQLIPTSGRCPGL
ncbi:MAG: hypothetical protein SOW45_08375, partial [Prevotella sp.]|nr:hypothetical protein [Prevotella sp.]